jgi:hypothetical protein
MPGTVLAIAQQAAMELGLPKPLQLVTSSQQTDLQLLALMNAAGSELVTYYEWQFLIAKHTITTVNGQSQYARPADFNRQINQTIWDKGNQRPVQGPVSSQGWQTLENSLIAYGPFARYRITQNTVELNPVPAEDGLDFNYLYVSGAWLESGVTPGTYLSMIAQDSDMPLFDFWLMVKFLKLKMWEIKGLDTQAIRDDFMRTFNALTGQSEGAPVLRISPCRGFPYITPANVPEGSWNVNP